MNRTDVTNTVIAAVYGPNTKVRVRSGRTRTDAVARIDGLSKVRVVVTETSDKTGVGIWGRYPSGASRVFFTDNLTPEVLVRFSTLVMSHMKTQLA